MTNRNRGFTLIELFIVLAILGILLAIFIPAFRDYKARQQFGDPTPVSAIQSENTDYVSTEQTRCERKAALMEMIPRYDALTGCTVQVGTLFVPIESVRFDANGNTTD